MHNPLKWSEAVIQTDLSLWEGKDTVCHTFKMGPLKQEDSAADTWGSSGGTDSWGALWTRGHLGELWRCRHRKSLTRGWHWRVLSRSGLWSGAPTHTLICHQQAQGHMSVSRRACVGRKRREVCLGHERPWMDSGWLAWPTNGGRFLVNSGLGEPRTASMPPLKKQKGENKTRNTRNDNLDRTPETGNTGLK